ncbi:DUF1972 domain-containing protein, partial [Enterococcus faecium]
LREKWSYPVRKYWKFSERLMVKNADLLICDSKNIEKYIRETYKKYKPKTTYIAYGTDMKKTSFSKNNEIVQRWFNEKKVSEGNYFLVVGRFVPENNYEVMIREFMKSNTKKDFVLVTNVEKNKFYGKLSRETGFDRDPRIKFVGTVYDQDLLKYIRENAFAYLHGHEVGGTNPSLLEALASTEINLLLDVGFNREVGENSAFYWRKKTLHELINKLETGELALANIESDPREVISNKFTWEKIIHDYENILLKG